MAQRARFAAIEEATQHLGKVDVYLIHTMPSAKALAKYKRLDAQIVAVDPGRDVVMARIEAMRSPEMKRVASRWYSQRTLPGASRSAMPQSTGRW
ncbi:MULTISPECIES: hypothetical protein [unclassified Streptomyces]|uniref:hypothetical protein n=1 Tax=unclassified Streptomyces TaxID=2593676 RepID=UPI001CB6FB56|nr:MULTISPECIES: hypothetical protein [unclassified Streptomyces]